MLTSSAHCLVATQAQLVMSDGQKNINSDEHVQQLQPGDRVLVQLGQQRVEQAVFKVR